MIPLSPYEVAANRKAVLIDRLNALHGVVMRSELSDEAYNAYIRVLEQQATLNKLLRVEPTVVLTRG